MKRRLATIVLGAAVLVSALAPHAEARTRREWRQNVSGTVYAPTHDACDLMAYEWALLETGARSGHVITYRFKIDRRTRGGSFRLRSTSAAPADLDIVFGPGYPSRARSFDGERGRVPSNAEYASVCLHAGAAADFTYTALRRTR